MTNNTYTDPHDQANWSLLLNNNVISLGDTVIDVGGHHGVYSHMFSSLLGATGKIHVFEIFPPSFRYLEMRFGHHSNIYFYNKAVSDRDGLESIHVSEQDEMCGILEMNGSKIGEIESVTLDTFFADEEKISLIKIDVEGAELNVLRGAKETLKKTDSLLLECHFDEHWPEIRKILIEENGFKCYNVDKRETVDETSSRPYQCFCRRD
tara:strand:- start:10297 stop:10920 length:624 start_codon:yes stop_codon:yes gene_type:complete